MKTKNQVVNLPQAASQLESHWSPKVMGAVDDSYVKVAKVKGEFTWHDHDEDEFFMVLDGNLEIQMEGGSVHLKTGDFYVVPKGVMHNPVAEEECTLLLFEKKSTLHTGKVKAAMTKSIEQQLQQSPNNLLE